MYFRGTSILGNAHVEGLRDDLGGLGFRVQGILLFGGSILGVPYFRKPPYGHVWRISPDAIDLLKGTIEASGSASNNTNGCHQLKEVLVTQNPKP